MYIIMYFLSVFTGKYLHRSFEQQVAFVRYENLLDKLIFKIICEPNILKFIF